MYIKEGLQWASEKTAGPVHVLEVGFGTGLNALLSWAAALEVRRAICFDTVEPFPLPREIWTELNYGDELGMRTEFETLHESPWETAGRVSPFFELTKRCSALQQTSLLQHGYNVVYFDAFAPEKQPEMWRPEVFAQLREVLVPGGILVTYCAKGQVKRDLKSSGFLVETLAGPPGKREMIRATRAG